MIPKPCKDCKWSYGYIPFMKCENPKNPTDTDHSTGEKKQKYLYCSILREDGFIMSRIFGMCGKRAKLFEPKTDGDKND